MQTCVGYAFLKELIETLAYIILPFTQLDKASSEVSLQLEAELHLSFKILERACQKLLSGSWQSPTSQKKALSVPIMFTEGNKKSSPWRPMGQDQI